MTCESLEKLQCIGNWLREGISGRALTGDMGIITDTCLDGVCDEDSDVLFDLFAYVWQYRYYSSIVISIMLKGYSAINRC
jgi:hypothetical protein